MPERKRFFLIEVFPKMSDIYIDTLCTTFFSTSESKLRQSGVHLLLLLVLRSCSQLLPPPQQWAHHTESAKILLTLLFILPPPQLLYKLNSASSDSSPAGSETLRPAPTDGGGIPWTPELRSCSRVPPARNYSRQNWNSTVGPPSCRHFHTVGNDDIS